MRKLEGLKEVYNNYDTFIIDLWGVMHNGITLNSNAINAIENLKKNSKKFVFLSNAPRPSANVINFLLKMKMDKKYLSNVMTSGEAAMYAINQKKFGKNFYHLGPKRDVQIFEKVKDYETTIDKCDFILCTGLFDKHGADLEYYKKLLKDHLSKKLICTNPDLTVHRGDVEELCAGSVAKIFEELGGEAVYFGKPYEEVYKMCFKKNERVLAIGDNLRTDIKGANILNFDCVYISEGVHRDEYNDDSELETLLKKYNVKANFYQKELKW